MSYNITNYDRLLIDFDGVLTNNKVYVDEVGKETVLCTRADGLAFDVLKKIKFDSLIFSTERSNVVSIRAQKLDVPFVSAVKNKCNKLLSMAEKLNWDLSRTVYIGNDVNDYFAMKLCGLKICPNDAHLKVKKISNIILNLKGGEGVIRELLEDVFKIDLLYTLYGEKE